MSVLLVSNLLFYIVITTFTWGFYRRAWSAFCMIFSWTPHSTIFNSPKCLHQILYLAIFSVFGTFRACIWVPQILPSGVSLERSSKIKFWWDVPILIFILMWNLELLPKVRTFEGKAVQRKQKQFWNLWKKNGTTCSTCSTCPFHQNENHCTDYVSDSILVVTNYLLIVMWFGRSPDCCQNGVDFQAGVHNFHSCTPPLD